MKDKKEKRKSGFFSDFKKFISRGNILDLAVAVIIGAAFGKIISSMVNDIIMPLISLALGGISFKDLKWVIRQANPAAGVTETALGYGSFIQATVDFLIIAICIFIMIRLIAKAQSGMNKLKQKDQAKAASDPRTPAQEPVPVKTASEELLTEIRDLLKQQSSAKEDEKA